MPPARRRFFVPLLACLAAASCNEFHQVGPEDPAELQPPSFVSVTVEYRQLNGCVNVVYGCDAPVKFYGSWMQPGAEFELVRDPGSFVWRGTARGVPVNWPPYDDPYEIRVHDPFLLEGENEGYVADRIRLGGEALVRFEGGGGPSQHALAYVDANGRGHNPY
jgi:hypothetical protein